ncbi:NADPH-dependent FMN reductase [Rhodovulum euryhalinum]|uniref:Chromate reductase n=1 Tax=Rhodovulum euryhalinum TaxID=35805 RepID=A0A4R2KCY2_9RHOB|nr:NADPH-dependent FMN reductase [Rhodovulum euryhalinum]TCO69967.1 chromate reductase [Rhodovulum euryhalinum]
MAEHRLLGISGSLRRGSFNTMLMREAARIFDPAEFAEADLRLPLYDGDIEVRDGIPAPVQRLADQIAAADAVVISGPEYNKSISGVLKNALDWVSRTKGAPWADKPVAILSAAAGAAGGPRTQFALRHCMVAFRPRLLQGPEVLVGNASQQFDDAGRLTNEVGLKLLAELMAALKAQIGR